MGGTRYWLTPLTDIERTALVPRSFVNTWNNWVSPSPVRGWISDLNGLFFGPSKEARAS